MVNLSLRVDDRCGLSGIADGQARICVRHIPHHLDSRRAIGSDEVRMRVVDAPIEKCHDHSLAGQSVLGECFVVLCRFIDGAVAQRKLELRHSQSEPHKSAKSFHWRCSAWGIVGGREVPKAEELYLRLVLWRILAGLFRLTEVVSRSTRMPWMNIPDVNPRRLRNHPCRKVGSQSHECTPLSGRRRVARHLAAEPTRERT